MPSGSHLPTPTHRGTPLLSPPLQNCTPFQEAGHKRGCFAGLHISCCARLECPMSTLSASPTFLVQLVAVLLETASWTHAIHLEVATHLTLLRHLPFAAGCSSRDCMTDTCLVASTSSVNPPRSVLSPSFCRWTCFSVVVNSLSPFCTFLSFVIGSVIVICNRGVLDLPVIRNRDCINLVAIPCCINLE